MPAVRTFIAIAASDETRAKAAELCGLLRASGARVTWTKPENMHLTLKFLGDTEESRLPIVCRCVVAAAAQVPAFELAFAGAGAFPDARRAQTLWIAAEAGREAAGELAERIERSMRPEGFPREQRAFKPHLTIGRVRSGSGAEKQTLCQLLADHRRFDAGVTAVREVVVLSSVLSPAGPSYDVIGRAPLAD